MRSGPIILIEDDVDDKEIMQEVINDCGFSNKLIWFNDCNDALEYLVTTNEQPFIILSDINLPKQSGIEMKKQIDEDNDLRRKSIPFVFFSTSADQKTVNEAFTQMTVQGFFQKSNSYEQIKKDIGLILQYWKTSKHPNTI